MGEMVNMMGDDAELDVRRVIGIINSMTPEERRNPKLIEPSRRNRIARGSGTQTQEVNQLVKQYEFVAPMMKAMAGKGIAGRMQAIRELQRSGAFDPGSAGRMPKMKGTTGKRLSPKEKKNMQKLRDRELRRRKRDEKRTRPGEG
jgi:signal recognition particle subunit SRP54